MSHDASKRVLLYSLTCYFIRPTEVLKVAVVVGGMNRTLPTWIVVCKVVFEVDEVRSNIITPRKCGN